MKLSYNDQLFNSTDPTWHFLAQYSLSELMAGTDPDDELVTNSLDALIGDLGIPRDCLYDIQKTLWGFVRQAAAHFDQENSRPRAVLRVYYQKKMPDNRDLDKSEAQYIAPRGTDPAQAIHRSDLETRGGWGYFLVERSVAAIPDASTRVQSLVDLYLYKEGG